MKKILAIFLALVFVLSLAACGSKGGSDQVDLKVGAILVGDETEG